MIATATNIVNKGDAILKTAVSRGRLSPCGLANFKATVDPFHDVPIKDLCGWCDQNTSPSVVRHWKQSATLKSRGAGASIVGYSWPILNYVNSLRCERSNNVVTNLTSFGCHIAPFVLYSFVDGNWADISGAAALQTTFQIPDEYFNDGHHRLIAMGVEIVDVTAEIYKQGTCSCFEVPQTVADTESVLVVAQNQGLLAYLATPTDVCTLNRFPSNLNGVMTYPTSVSWDAKEGAYLVAPFGVMPNPSLYAEYRQPWVQAPGTSGTRQDQPAVINNSEKYLGEYIANTLPNEHFVFSPNCFAPINSRGCALTGLNAESTFTITVTFYLETFPQYGSPILPMASPSAPCDERALALISQVMQSMPVACMVKDNPNGEWFWEALEAALPLLGMTASAVLPEFAPLIGTGTAALTRFADEKRQRANQRSRNQKQLVEMKREIKKLDLTAKKLENTANTRQKKK